MKRNPRKRGIGANESLDDIREQVRDVTRSILKLAKARQTLSEKVARFKKAGHLDVEDKRIEEKLVSSMEDYAIEIGLERNLAREITKGMIESSKIVQRRSIYLEEIKAFLSERKISRVSIVGAGRMGCWFASYFRPLVKSVALFDSDGKVAGRRARELGCEAIREPNEVGKADLIVVAVPISRVSSEVKALVQVASGTRSAPRVIEVSSVKTPVLRELDGLQDGVHLISVHPLFGSSADHFACNSMIVIQTSRGKSGLPFIRRVFPHYKIFAMSSGEHDKLMTLMLSLPHALSIIFGEVVAKSGKVPEGLSGPSFQTMMQASRKVFSENPKVYFEIQSTNENNAKMMEEIRSSLEHISSLLQEENYPAFKKFFEETAKYLELGR